MSELLSGWTLAGAAVTGFWRRAKVDDTALFEELASRYEERFYRVAYRMTGSHEAAQDLLQEALIEAFRAFSHFRRGTYFDKWLFRIMTRTFIDSKRAKRPVVCLSLDEPQSGGGSESGRTFEIPDDEYNPAYQIERYILAEPLQNALDQLPAQFRLVLILSDVEQMSYDEIAEMIDCPIGTVRSRLHRARAMMCEKLKASGFQSRLL